jgi:flagellar biosynthesis protein FlhG
MSDQAERLRELVSRMRGKGQPSRARIVAVTSGKGGVGKSMLTANLAVILAQAGKKVLAVDADLGLSNLDVIFNAYGRFNLSHVLDGQASFRDCIVQSEGVSLLSGGSGIGRLAHLTYRERLAVLEGLVKAAHEYDYVLVDTGAGISSSTMSFVLSADESIVVTTPEPTAMTDAYALIKTAAARKPQGNMKLLVNMARDRAEGLRTAEKMCLITRQFLSFHLDSCGCIPQDDAVPRSVRERKPFVIAHPASRASYAVKEAAGKIFSAYAAPTREKTAFASLFTEWFSGVNCL